MLDQARLKQFLRYDPDTGLFERTAAPMTTLRFIGQPVGSIQKSGYVRICVDGRYYYAHRLAFLYMVGVWPQNQIDHEDKDRSNNKWDNIRPATFPQNAANSDRRNKHGLRGVAFRADRNKRPWSAGITIAGKRRHLGYFASAEEAHAAYKAAQREAYGDFAK